MKSILHKTYSQLSKTEQCKENNKINKKINRS